MRRCPWLLALALAASAGARQEPDLQIEGLRPLAARHPDAGLRTLERRSGLRTLYLSRDVAFGRYRCDAARPDALASAARAARATLAGYPDTLPRRIGLAYLLFCADLRDRSGGRPGGVPNLRAGALLLDLAALAPGERAYRAALHHEIFHFIDAADGGYADLRWESHNPVGFRYRADGAGLGRRGGVGALGSGGLGFVTAYARSAVAEDKAELYRWLRTDPGAVARLAASDPILQRKIAHLHDELARFAPALAIRLRREWQAGAACKDPERSGF